MEEYVGYKETKGKVVISYIFAVLMTILFVIKEILVSVSVFLINSF